MIDPEIFSFKLIYWTITLRWYGVLVMLGAVVGAWWAEREIRRRGENGEVIWDAMVWVLPIGILGARLWYVVNTFLSGNTYYIDKPFVQIKFFFWTIDHFPTVLAIWEGGLHFFGGLLFGMIALYFFLQRNKLDTWLFLDALAPATLLGQALARPANFINQELYGPPTNLPWGIQIMAEHRLPQYPVSQFPVDITRFHPTFAYEMILNILIVLFLWWLSRRYEEDLKPGAIFSLWLLLAGLSRTIIEFFRPDQPRIGDTFISYTMLVSFLMAITGLVLLLARYGKLQLAWAETWEDEYQVKKAEKQELASIRNVAAPAAIAPVALNEKVSSKRSANAVLDTKNKKSPVKKVPTKKTAAKSTTEKKPAAKK